jgi:hypothetical protein
VLGLTVKSAPRRAKVRVTCKGGGCPATAIRPKLRKRALDVGNPFGRRWLRPGAVVELRVTRARMVAEVVRYRIRSGGRYPQRADLCLAPGAKKPRRC